MKSRQIVPYKGEKYSLTVEQTWREDKYNNYGYVASSRMPKNDDILGAFGCQETNKISLGEWNDP